MQDEDANLLMIKTLKEKYNCYVGYSGHESGLAVSHAAAALVFLLLKDILLLIGQCMDQINLHRLSHLALIN